MAIVVCNDVIFCSVNSYWRSFRINKQSSSMDSNNEWTFLGCRWSGINVDDWSMSKCSVIFEIVLLFAGDVDMFGKNDERISFKRIDGTCAGDSISIIGWNSSILSNDDFDRLVNESLPRSSIIRNNKDDQL